jgi:hypothetical protein
MKESKRLSFLKSFLKLYEVKEIKLISQSNNLINGIAIYDEVDHEERQEFVWHVTENEVPSDNLKLIIEKIVVEKWHDGDKIFNDIEKIQFDEFDANTRDELLNELFDVQIRMIDDGEETDSYFVHY